MNKIIVKGGRELRYGFTTGSAAAAAAAAASALLLGGERALSVRIRLPSSEYLDIEIDTSVLQKDYAQCSVIKDGGDDPDATDGIRISARVERQNDGITLRGGTGVGVITQPGLKIPVGEAAINPVPRAMISENVAAVCKRFGYSGGLTVTICAEGGEEIAKRTFNPRLGIVGGISILGTSGIVEPMSSSALIDTIKLELEKKRCDGRKIVLLCPGNYGRDYCRSRFGFDLDAGVKYSNYLGEALDYAVYLGFEHALIISHIGKLVKVAAGVMNTHSMTADCRMEVFAAHSAMAGMSREQIKTLMQCSVTEEAIKLIETDGKLSEVCETIKKSICSHLDFRTKNALNVEFAAFRNDSSLLFQTDGVDEYAANIIQTERSTE